MLAFFVLIEIGQAQIKISPPWSRPEPPPSPPARPEEEGPPRLSQDPADKTVSGRHFVFVDYEYIFTLELTDNKTPILNFANITDHRHTLSPSHIQLFSRGRRYPVKFLVMDTGNDRETITIPSTKIYAHSSFGYALKGDFNHLDKLDRATVRLNGAVIDLEPVSKNDFEMLAHKINRINLASPDIRDDFRVLRIALKGKRTRPE
ncbi:MAG: hypothetical protein HY232_08080 [Acidobacteria bacterium]|nr:hypothetical protein [Acidobacteriota bacterium]